MSGEGEEFHLGTVLDAARAYEAAWNAYANPTRDGMRRPESELLLAWCRAHQDLLNATRTDFPEELKK